MLTSVKGTYRDGRIELDMYNDYDAAKAKLQTR